MFQNQTERHNHAIAEMESVLLAEMERVYGVGRAPIEKGSSLLRAMADRAISYTLSRDDLY